MARDDYGAINVISDEERDILGIGGPKKPEEDEEKLLPPVEDEDVDVEFDEDLLDNWCCSNNPERSLGARWTGRTECESLGGDWVPFSHEDPREVLFIPRDVSRSSLDGKEAHRG